MNFKPGLVSILMTVFSVMGFAQAPQDIQPRPYSQSKSAGLDIPEWKDTDLGNSLKKYYETVAEKQRELSIPNSKAWAFSNKGGGGMDGGGGNIVKKHALFFDELLDLVNFPLNEPLTLKKFKLETRTSGLCSLSAFTQPPPELTLTLTRLFQPLIGLNQSSATSRYLGLSGIKQTDLVELAIKNFTLVLDENDFSPALVDINAYIRESKKSLTLYPAAFYIQGRGLILSRPSLARLSAVSQYGLLVHEILRQISIGYELYISDYDLQKITSALLEKSRPEYRIENDLAFVQSGLPAEMYLGPLTKYIIRNHLNDICATYAAVSKQPKESPLCQSIATTDIEQMYAMLPRMKDEMLRLYSFENISPENGIEMWQKQLSMAHESLLIRANSYTREMRSSTLVKAVLEQGAECKEVSRFLSEGK